MPQLQLSAGSLTSLLTWAARRSDDVKQMWLRTPISCHQVNLARAQPFVVVHVEQDAACWLLRTAGIIRHAPPLPQGGQDVDVTDRVLDKLRALVTLRIDKFCGYVGAAMCVTVLASMAHRPGTAQLLHLSLYQLPLPPDNPQLVAAIQAHTGLVVSKAPLCSSKTSCGVVRVCCTG
jgi:hypothetical protein